MTSKVRITVLVENTAQGPGVLAEHGLAYWITWNDRHVLFDTGQGGVLASNGNRLGIPLSSTDAIVLSHGHYDHTGGLAEVLRSGTKAPIYLHPAALAPKYVRNKDGTSRAIGMPETVQEALRQYQAKLIPTESPTTILEGLTVTGPVPRSTDFEDTGGAFYLDQECLQPDPLVDDQSLFFATPEGIVVLLGCAHSGVINTLRYVCQLSKSQTIRAVIGGSHLVGASSMRIAQTIDELRRLGVQRVAPAHCTGTPATVALWNAFPKQCSGCHVGSTFEFAC